jgi:uncharacterized repeat protein (TIGR03803 family)
MQCEKCFRALASAVIIAAAVLALSGAATAASTYKIIDQFEVPKVPVGNLTWDAAGNLYGTTVFGGDSTACSSIGPGGCGVIWKLASDGKLTMLYQFTGGEDGALPYGGVIFDMAGNLYGTTAWGGSGSCSSGNYHGCGVVFKLAPNPEGTWTESVLHNFTGSPDGAGPTASLIFDAAGNLYGTAGGGASSSACPGGCGTVFKLAPNPDGTWTESVLYSFTGGADGNGPAAGLVFDPDGNLYSTTGAGGSGPCSGSNYHGCGVVFKLAPNPDGSWTESVLHSFAWGPDGRLPQAGLIFDGAGNLYGTTFWGGAKFPGYGCGVVFKLKPKPDGTWAESVLHRFAYTDGCGPSASLTFDAAGNLYGTTVDGNPSLYKNYGFVFELTPNSSGWSETVLHAFLGLAYSPESPVIFDPKGNLYGTTAGGMHNYGVVFEITP